MFRNKIPETLLRNPRDLGDGTLGFDDIGSGKAGRFTYLISVTKIAGEWPGEEEKYSVPTAPMSLTTGN